MDQIVVESSGTAYSQLTKTISVGIIVVLIFDALASLSSLWFSLDYGSFSIGSAFIYFLVGYSGSRRSSFVNSLIAVFFVALADLTLGWAISWFIGPGRIVEGLTLSIFILVVLSVFPFALLFGALGGLVSRWI